MSYNLKPASRHEMFLADILEKFNIILGGGSGVIEPLTITENGTYEAPEGVDGYSPVVVNVAGGGEKILYMDAALLNAGGAYPVDADDYTTAVIPAEATFVSLEAFANLPNLDTLIVNGDCEFETYNEYDNFTKSYTFKNPFSQHLVPIRKVVTRDCSMTPEYFMQGVTPLVDIDISGSLGNNSFNDCTYLRKVALENCESIGNCAFMSCRSLKEITIPDGVTSIGGSAFIGCWSMTKVTIPDSVNSIGGSAFSGCSALPEITIPEGVTTIGHGLCRNCTSLTEVTIPASVTSIENEAFSGCTNLETVTILGMETTFAAITAQEGAPFPSTTKIRGYAGSTAETWATENGYTFEVIA